MSLFPDEIEKQVYEVDYKKMKAEGYPFVPFATWKDIVVALGVLVALIFCIAYFGVHYDAPADPTSQFLPRPEWYFMFLFELLKYFPGPWAIIPVAILPGAIGGVLIALPFLDRNPYRSIGKRPYALVGALVSALLLVGLTVKPYMDDARDPHSRELQESAEKQAEEFRKGEMFAGPSGKLLFQSNCVVCHGAAGNQIPNVALLGKAFIADRNVVEILTNGKGGMPAFKGKLQPNEMEAISAYLKAEAK